MYVIHPPLQRSHASDFVPASLHLCAPCFSPMQTYGAPDFKSTALCTAGFKYSPLSPLLPMPGGGETVEINLAPGSSAGLWTDPFLV